jgi:phosphoglucomutase
VVTQSGWFAARPSGTEDVYKLYAESFKGGDHLGRIQEEAQAVIQRAFQAGDDGRGTSGRTKGQ